MNKRVLKLTVNSNYGIDINEYNRIHNFLRKKYIKSGICSLCGAKPKTRTEFALKDGRSYTKNIDDYIELCVPCHRKKDTTDYQRLAARMRMKGQVLTKKKVCQLNRDDNSLIKVWSSSKEAAINLGILTTSISNCINGRSSTAGGFKWKIYEK